MKTSVLVLICLGITYMGRSQKEDTLKTQPKENIRVNKEYNENGDLTSYDSIYTYSWSGDSLSNEGVFSQKMRKEFIHSFKQLSDSDFNIDHFFDEDISHEFAPFFSEDPMLSFDSFMRKFNQYQKDHFFNIPSDSLNNFSKEDTSMEFSEDLFYNDMRKQMEKHWKEVQKLYKELESKQHQN